MLGAAQYFGETAVHELKEALEESELTFEDVESLSATSALARSLPSMITDSMQHAAMWRLKARSAQEEEEERKDFQFQELFEDMVKRGLSNVTCWQSRWMGLLGSNPTSPSSAYFQGATIHYCD